MPNLDELHDIYFNPTCSRLIIFAMDESYGTGSSDFNSSSDSGRDNGYEIPSPPVSFSRNFSHVCGTLMWSYRWFHPKGDQDFRGDLFSLVHVIAHPFSQVKPDKWSDAERSAFRSLSPETAYEIHQTVRFALPIEQLARSVYIKFERYADPEHDLVQLLMETELVKHVIAHADVRRLDSLFACYYLTDGHNRCEYYLTLSI